MASASLYRDGDDDAITDINVTPFVDVVLVLLVVFMVTAKLIVTRGIDIDKPKAVAGGAIQSTLRISIDSAGVLFINGNRALSDGEAIADIQRIAGAMETPKAIITGDQRAAYGGVMHAIDLVKRAGNYPIALENIAPSP
jgi:biopolymer transport protein ExbD